MHQHLKLVITHSPVVDVDHSGVCENNMACMVVDWKRFVPGAEVEDLSFAATESTRGAKDFASLKPTNHY